MTDGQFISIMAGFVAVPITVVGSVLGLAYWNWRMLDSVEKRLGSSVDKVDSKVGALTKDISQLKEDMAAVKTNIEWLKKDDSVGILKGLRLSRITSMLQEGISDVERPN